MQKSTVTDDISVKDIPAGSEGRSPETEDIHMGEAGLLHKLLRRKKLEGLFLFVTSQCNSRCRTCFYHENLNDGNDMTLDQMRRISETAPAFDKLWLSGGEPFMREDLAEIIELFYRNNKIRVINLPTNGILTGRIEKTVGRLLETCPGLTIHLNFSLDGLGNTHDANRGVPGNFTKTVGSMERMKGLHGDNPRLLRNVATVITPDSYDQMFDLGAYLLQKDLVATHFFEVVRGDPKDPSTKGLTPDEIASLRKKIYPLINRQAENLFKDFSGLKKRLARVFFLGFIKFVNDLQDKNYTGPAPWGMACTAGKTTIVVDHNGDFRSCEMRPPVGNLSDYGFNLSAALFSEAMRNEIKEIGNGSGANCWCTHGCWIMSSIKFSPRALLFRIPMAYRRLNRALDRQYVLPVLDVSEIENYRN